MIKRRTFLRGVAALFAVAAVDAPRLIAPDNRPGAGLDFEVLREQWVINPQDFGDIYMALVRVGSRYCAVTCAIADRTDLELRAMARASARDHAMQYVRSGGGLEGAFELEPFKRRLQ